MRFPDAVKHKARFRQWGRCGMCGDPLSYVWEEAHHIKPQASGGTASVDNCVILCYDCHAHVHNNANYRSLVVAPKSYYPFLNGR